VVAPFFIVQWSSILLSIWHVLKYMLKYLLLHWAAKSICLSHDSLCAYWDDILSFSLSQAPPVHQKIGSEIPTGILYSPTSIWASSSDKAWRYCADLKKSDLIWFCTPDPKTHSIVFKWMNPSPLLRISVLKFPSWFPNPYLELCQSANGDLYP
jgi:hypothetical protein